VITIRKLAAVDMAWIGPRVILAEYALGIVLPVIFGLISIRSGLLGWPQAGWEVGVGLWLVTISGNYVPLFIYALLIAQVGTVKVEGEPEFARARRYGIQQVIILIPFLVVILAVLQERRRRRRE
jgi:hypothetical protein